jgi:hypothetical protein
MVEIYGKKSKALFFISLIHDHFKIMSLKVIPYLFFVVLSLAGFSQEKPEISISEKEFDFGTIRETDGTINHDFIFINKGKVPLIINDVKSSCGCTVPSWPREPVLPGRSGTISVSFNPEHQSGVIGKTIQIQSNASTPKVTLGLKGVVIPAQRMEETYKFTIGDLRLQTIYAAFGEVLKEKTATYSIKILNNSDSESIRVTFKHIPQHLRITVNPEKLEPRQEGTIDIEYNASLNSGWDYQVDRLNMLINGKELPNNRINITANLREDFSMLTAEQLAAAARAQFDTHQFDFGNITADKLVEHTFYLTNTGKSDLYIRKVSASCGCTAVQPAKTKIVPGDSTAIKAVFNAKGKSGAQKKAITVITNDPRQSRSVLWVSAFIGDETGNKVSE